MENFAPNNNEIAVHSVPSKSSLKKRILGIAGVFCAIGIIGWYALRAPSDFPSNGTLFTISEGESLKSVVTRLKDEHYIRSRIVLSTLVTFWGREGRLSVGDYYFSHPLSAITIARQIAFGNHNLLQIKITVPEGMTVSEMASVFEAKLPNFPTEQFVIAGTPYEGYLFPETYFFYPKATVDTIITRMQSMFDQQTSELFSEKVFTKQQKKDLVILASLIEREAHGDDDRATIAGILLHRLALGMPLQVDATVAYANNKAENSLVKSDFSIDSPYNTYKDKGLPPTPISNPGLAALTAAAHPTQTSYLYYLHDKHGTIHYAKTYAEHLANIKKYLK